MGNLRMNADQISYKGGEKPMSVEEAIKNAGNTGLAHTADIAPDFSTESAYSAGDYVYHSGTLYVFTSNHAAGAWSTSDTQAVTVGNELSTLKSGLTNKAHVPSSSASSLGSISGGSSDNFTPADDGYLSINCSTDGSQVTFSAIIRDSSLDKYGVFITGTVSAYSAETIGGLFVKKGRTYNVRNTGENEITVYLCT